MNILITNDDGIQAHGIIRLAKAAAKLGEVWVVAPDNQRSGASHSVNLRTPIEVHRVSFPIEGVHAYSVAGSPADCARIGILGIMDQKLDVVLSGINYGYNAGGDAMYSGTIGAAMEAAYQGILSIALSEGTQEGYRITDLYLDQILQEVIRSPYVPGQIINVNFPTCKSEEVKGILRDCILSKGRMYEDRYVSTQTDEEVYTFQVQGTFMGGGEPGSDVKALLDHYITIGKVKDLC